MAEGCGGHAGI